MSREMFTSKPAAVVGSSGALDLTAALMDPAAVFAMPSDVLRDFRLNRDKKIEVLYRWLYDATELAVAEEEGMGSGEPSKLGAVLAALHELTGGIDVEHAGPTKHGALRAHMRVGAT